MKHVETICKSRRLWLFDAIDLAIGGLVGGIGIMLSWLPGVALAGIIVLLALWRVGWKFAAFACVAHAGEGVV